MKGSIVEDIVADCAECGGFIAPGDIVATRGGLTMHPECMPPATWWQRIKSRVRGWLR